MRRAAISYKANLPRCAASFPTRVQLLYRLFPEALVASKNKAALHWSQRLLEEKKIPLRWTFPEHVPKFHSTNI
jgi:hypothetical protein